MELSIVKDRTGGVEIVIKSVIVLLSLQPLVSVMLMLTLFIPGSGYVYVGLKEDEKLPSPKSQNQEEIEAEEGTERSMN